MSQDAIPTYAVVKEIIMVSTKRWEMRMREICFIKSQVLGSRLKTKENRSIDEA